jgi:hypothetical protein
MQKTHKYEQSGIPKLTCQSCHNVYIKQTGRSLKTRYKEHLRSIKNNKDDSAFAEHVLNTGHLYEPMEQLIEMIEGTRKGRTMNIKENFYIYQFNHDNNLIQEQKHTKEGDHQNSLFDIVVKLDLPQHLRY